MAALAQPFAALPVSAGPPPLRIGIFAARREQPRVLISALAALGETGAELVAVAIGNQPRRPVHRLWQAYRVVDRKVFGADPRLIEPVDLLSGLRYQNALAIPLASTAADALAHWRSRITDLHLDVLLVLGDLDPLVVAGLARLGSWRLEYGGQPGGNGLEGFVEVLRGDALSQVSLRGDSLGSRDQSLTAWTRTAPFSVSRNREKLLRRGAQLPARLLRDLQSSPPPIPPASAPGKMGRPIFGDLSIPFPPAHLLNPLWRMVKRAWEKLLYVDQWFIAYRFSAPGDSPDPAAYTCLMPPLDRFWADPFPLIHKGRHYIFFEELIFAQGKAHIAMVELLANGRHSQPQRVLARPYHLSYPCLIEAGGELYMVPESSDNGTVELYRCTQFPHRWRQEKVLLRAPGCVDASFCQHGGWWWMFVTIGQDGNDVHDEICLYYAPQLTGEWRPHPANPLKSDVRSARSAGRPFFHDGHWYRPAQIGVPHYGSGIVIHRILTMTPEDYEEEAVESLLPPLADGILGLHTLNREGRLTVIDGFTRRRRLGGRTLHQLVPERAILPENWL